MLSLWIIGFFGKHITKNGTKDQLQKQKQTWIMPTRKARADHNMHGFVPTGMFGTKIPIIRDHQCHILNLTANKGFDMKLSRRQEIIDKVKLFNIYIVDDGTLDTVVSFKDTLYRFDSEYRFSFDSDKAFLLEVKETLEKQIDWWGK